MKKQFFLLLLGLTILTTNARSQCQAYFTFYQDSTYLYMYDQSHNNDSSAINVLSWNWTLSGMGLNYTYSTQNPSELISNLPAGIYILCLEITTATSCSNTHCDSVVIGNTPISNCHASFMASHVGNVFTFTDQSTTTGGESIVAWNWTFQDGNPSSSTLQNPVVTFPTPNTTYALSLTITTNMGCSDSVLGYIYFYDSLPCINYVDANVYNVTVPGGNDGAIDLTVYGGTPPYNFYWNNGATTEDIYGLPSGIYTATVVSDDSMCSPYTITANVLEPYDSSNVVVDTLYTSMLDSCLNFVPDSFFISSISTQGNVVTVYWVFTGAGQTAVISIDYTFSTYGTQLVVLSINCDSAKAMSTYMSFIYIHPSVGINETIPVLNVYPNPAGHQINLPDGEFYTRLRLIGMDGSILLDLNNAEGKIDVSSIPEGIYIILGENSSGVISGRLNIVR